MKMGKLPWFAIYALSTRFKQCMGTAMCCLQVHAVTCTCYFNCTVHTPEFFSLFTVSQSHGHCFQHNCIFKSLFSLKTEQKFYIHTIIFRSLYNSTNTSIEPSTLPMPRTTHWMDSGFSLIFVIGGFLMLKRQGPLMNCLD